MLIFEAERPSESPYVERVWRCHSEGAGSFLSIAESRWEMVITRHQGQISLTVRGPETQATPLLWSEDVRRWKQEELFNAAAYLLGRRTYQEFASVWPQITDDTGFADRMNSMPKYVVSTTLSEAAWHNSSILTGDIVHAVDRLKQEVDQDILVAGSSQLVRVLVQHDLIDEYRLLIHPIMVGRGAPFFKDLRSRRALKLAETKTFERGIVLLCYQPA